MARETGFESQKQGGRKRRPEGRPLRTVSLVAIALLCTWLLSLLGVTDAANSNLRRLYYLMRGERQTAHDVIFVAIDESTVDTWGAPPWRWTRYSEMVAGILKGKPRLVAFLEPGPRLLPGDLPAALADLKQAVAEGRVIAPSARPGFGQPQLDVGPRGVVEQVVLGSARDLEGPSVTRDVLTRAGWKYEGDTLPVNFYGGPDSLPTVPAHRIATGEIPPRTFTDRIVVVGLRGERFAPIVPTPVGAMSPSEVHAHALLGLANGVTWAPLPVASDFLLAALLALVCATLLHRLPTALGFAGVAGLSLLTMAGDFFLFRGGTVLLGAAVPVTASIAAAAGSWLMERARAHHDLEELTRFIAQKLAVESRKRRGGGNPDENFWERFAEAARIYLEFDSTMFGELKPGDFHLNFRTFVNTSEDDIFERRRDIRRDPYKRAYLSHKPMWTNRQFMAPEKKVRSLMVPLVAFNRAFGFWVINFPQDAELSRSQMEIVEQLADQIALAIERRRLEEMMAGEHGVERLPAEGQLVAHIKEMREAAFSLMQEQQSLAMLFDRLPVGVVVATLWGEVQFANESVRRFLRQFDTLADKDVQKHGLPSLLAELTGGSENVINEMLRELVNDGNPVRLSGRVAPSLGPSVDYELVVSRLGQGVKAEGEAGVRLLSDFVMTVTERVEKRADVTDWTMKVKGAAQKIGKLVDLRVMVRELIADLQAERGGKSTRPIMVEVPDNLPAIRVDDEITNAMRSLLRDATANPSDEPLRIVVESERKELVMHLIDAAAVLPRKELDAAVNAAESAGAEDDFELPEHLRAFVAAKRSIETAGLGQMGISSGLADGTSIDLRIPRRRRET